MATGLKFIADGGEQFLKTLDKIEKAARKFDKTLESLAKKSDALDRAIRSSGQGFQSTNRALDATIRRFKEIDTLLADVARKMPAIANSIKQGFSGGGLEQFFRQSGVKLAEAFIAGMEGELGIRSPSRVMQRIGQDSLAGFIAGIDLGRMAVTGVAAAGRFVASFSTAIVSGIRGIAGQVRQAAESALRGVEEAFRRAGQNLQRQGQSLIQGGIRTIMVGGIVGLMQSAVIAMPIQAATQFESAFAGVMKTLDLEGLGEEQAAQFAQGLRSGLRELAIGDTPLAGLDNAALQLSEIAEAAGQLGIARDRVLDFTEVIGQLTLATDLTAEAASFNLAQFANIMRSTRFEEMGSAIVALGNNSATTESMILEFAQRLAGAGATAGFTEPQILAIGTAMASLGLNAEAGGSAMTQVFGKITSAVATNSRELQEVARISGMSASEFAQHWRDEPVAALTEFIIGIGQLDNEMQVLALDSLGLDGLRVADVLRRMAGNTDLLTDSLAIAEANFVGFGETSAEYNALQEEAAQRFQTTAAQVARLNNIFFDLKVTVGEFLLPTFRGLVAVASDVLAGINAWMKANPELAGTLVRVATAGAMVVAGLVTLSGVAMVVSGALSFGLGGALIGVANGFGLIASLLFNPLGVIAGIAGFASGLVAAIPLIGLVVAAIAGIGVVISDIKNNVGGAGDAFREFTQSLRDLFGGIVGLVADVGRVFQHLFRAAPAVERSFSPVTGVLQTITGLVDGLVQRINTIREFVRFAGGMTSVGNEVQRNQEINSLMAERERIVADIAAKEAEIASGTGETETHLVKQGDTLYDIAARYGTTVEALREANDLQSNIITIGQELVLGVGAVDTSQAEADLKNLRDRLKEVDFGLSGLATAREMSLGALNNVRPELDRVREGIGLVKTAFDEFIAGNWTAGFDTLKTGISEIGDGIRDVWSAFQEQQGDSSAVGTAALAGFGDAGIQVDTGGGLAGAIQSQLNSIATADFSQIKQAIADNIEDVIRGAVSIVGIVLGGPAGMALGLANLVATAIENDFLGISTFLDKSGIRTSVDNALAEVWRVVQEAVSGFSLGTSPAGDSSAVGAALLAGFGDAGIAVDTGGTGNAITQVISDLMNGVRNAASLFTPELRETLDQVVSGITGFINNLSGADTSGLDEIVAFILRIGGAIAGAAGFLLMAGIDNLGNIAQNVLPPLGTALSGIITALSGVGEGDPSKIIEGLGQALGGLKDALSGWTMGTADSALHAIERLTGWELPDAQMGIDALVGGLQNAWLALQIVVDNIRRSLHRFFLETKLSILQGIADIIEPIRGELEALGINVFPNLEFEMSGIRRELEDFNIDEQIRAAVAQGGLLTATVPVAIAIHPETGEDITRDIPIAEMIASPEQLSRMSVATRQMVEQAVKTGLADEAIDISDARLLLAGAENLQLDFAGLDMTGVVDALLDEAIATGDSATFTIGMENLVAQGLDVNALQQSVSDQIQTALDEGDTETVIDLANLGIVLGVDMDALFAENPIDLGTQAGQAIADGLAEANIDLTDSGIAMGDAIKSGINTSLGISSPATFGITAGQAIADGMVIGVQNLSGRFNEAVNPIKAKFAEIGIAAGLAGIAMSIAGGVMIGALSGVRSVADGVLQQVLQLKAEMLGLGFAVIQDIPGLNAAPPPGGIPGRAEGGGISRGMMYEVVEDESEVAVIGGRTYLIPAADGYVIPPRALSAADVFSPRSGAGADSSGTRIEIRYGDMQINLPQEVGTPDEMRDAVFAAIDEYNKQVTPEEVLRDIE